MKIETFHKLTLGADQYPPLCFNNPFNYVPHPLCVEASLEVREHVLKEDLWIEELAKGKMFGVLVVDKNGELGYLAAFSGQLNGKSIVEGFVPPIFDTNASDYFQKEMSQILITLQKVKTFCMRELAI